MSEPLSPPPIPPSNPPIPRDPRLADAASKKLAAGLCAILLGNLGIHKFILGYNHAGLIMLLVTVLTCGIGGLVIQIIALVEGIIYLTKSDEDFLNIYILNRKDWF